MTDLPAPSTLPRGTVTFLFTDVEGSTALWEDAPESMMDALRAHDSVIDEVVERHNGVGVKPRGEGDSRFVVFTSAVDAVAATAAIQQGLARVDWPTPRPIRVRASLHTGTAELQLGDYYGSTVNRAARLRAIAHGGQSVMSESTWQLVRDSIPDGVAIRDMGEHRLKDLTRPEHVYQIDPDGLATDFPPLASLDAVPTNLPVQVTDFVGRERELAGVRDALERSRLVTILAPGGAGKTRLAIQTAADLAGDYPHGVFFADLAPVDDIADVPQVVADAVGVTLGGDEDQQTQLLAHLSGKRMLLVVDNVEHIPEVPDLVGDILRDSDSLRLVATSRTKLNVAGEAVFRLTGLDHAWTSVEEAYDSSAVRLFADAARRADAGFELSADDLDPLQRLLDLVGGLPLGIILAASWADTLTLNEIADEVARSMDFLESETRDMPERHRSMRAVFEYSWSLLSPDEQRSLAALSVFRGGFTREAAGAVAGAQLRALARLESKSLIALDRDARRYSIHEVVREFAAEELSKDAALTAACVSAHTAFFTELGGRCVDDFMKANDQAAALDAMENDFQNLRSVLRRAIEDRSAPAALAILPAIQFLMETRGWLQANHDLLGEVTTAFRPGGTGDEQTLAALSRALRARVAVNLGLAGDHAAEVEHWTDVLSGLPNELAYGIALEALCETTAYAGRGDRVLEVTAEAIALAERAGEDLWAAAMKNYEGLAWLLLEQPDRAMIALRAGDDVLRAQGESFMRAWNLENQATIAQLAGDVERSIAIRREQIDLARSVRYARVEALAAFGMGSCLVASGDLDGGSHYLNRSLEIFDNLGMVLEEALVLLEYATLLTEQGNPRAATEVLGVVEAHRAATLPHPFQPVLVGDLVANAMAELQGILPEADFSAARESGRAKRLPAMVERLIAS